MSRTGVVAVLCACVWISSACSTREFGFERDGQMNGIERDGQDYTETFRQNYEVNPGGTLTVDAELGAIHIKSSILNEVDVLVRKRYRATDAGQIRKAFSNVEVGIEQTDNDVRIDVDQIDDNAENWFWQEKTRVEIEVTVPVEFNLDLSTIIDDIQTGMLEGNVTAKTLTGNIRTGPTEGDLRIKSVSGNIVTSRIVGKVHTTTLTGNIEIGPVDGDATVGTNSGDIQTNYVHGKLKTTTLTGNITNRHHTPSSAQEETTIIRDDAEDAGLVEQTQHSFPVEAGGTLMTDNAFASIEIGSWTKNEVSVTVEKRSDVLDEDRARRAFDDIEVKSEKRNNDVYITVDGPDSRRRNQVEIQITVQVPERYNLYLESSGGDIEIHDLRGDIYAKSSGGDVVMGNIRESTVDVRTTGGDIRLESGDADTMMKTSSGDVQIENAGGRTDVQTSGGDIRIEHADGEVDVRTTGGDIQIEHASGRLSIETSGGDIQIENAMEGVDAESEGGDIDIENARGAVTVRTTGGDIDIENVQGSVTAKTLGGDIDIQLTGTDTSNDRSCELESSGGEVKVYLPEDLAATIDAKVHLSISRFWGRGDYRVYSEFDLSGKNNSSRNPTWAWVYGRSGHAKVWGDINGGGDLIRIETTNGNIRIKKL